MKFTKTSEQLPKIGEEVVIRYKYANSYLYYVCVLCHRSSKDNTLIFEEAGGEQYSWWNIDDVEAWMYASELDAIE